MRRVSLDLHSENKVNQQAVEVTMYKFTAASMTVEIARLILLSCMILS